MKTKSIRNVFGGPIFASVLLQSPLVEAEKTQVRAFVGVYDKFTKPIFGMGMNQTLSLPAKFVFDGSFFISLNGKDIGIESYKLTISSPKWKDNFFLSAYAYSDNFLTVKPWEGFGAVFSFYGAQLAGEYLGPNKGNLILRYPLKLWKNRIRLIPQANIVFSEPKVNAVVAQFLGEIDLWKFTIYGRVIHSRDPNNGAWLNGNMQFGLGYSFK